MAVFAQEAGSKTDENCVSFIELLLEKPPVIVVLVN